MTNDQLKQIDEMVENQKLLHEPEPICRCDICRCGLFEGEHYWRIDEEILCDECADEMYGMIMEEE